MFFKNEHFLGYASPYTSGIHGMWTASRITNEQTQDYPPCLDGSIDPSGESLDILGATFWGPGNHIDSLGNCFGRPQERGDSPKGGKLEFVVD